MLGKVVATKLLVVAVIIVLVVVVDGLTTVMIAFNNISVLTDDTVLVL